MQELASFLGENLKDADSEAVGKKLDGILSQKESGKLYPQGPPKDPSREAKGSVALQMLFASYGLRYEKRKVGRLIATKITEKNQPLLNEIWKLFPRDFLHYK
jgi:hypothetical protein